MSAKREWLIRRFCLTERMISYKIAFCLVSSLTMIISDNQIHIWHIKLDAKEETASRLERYLSIAELKKANLIKNTNIRIRFILSKVYLRSILSKYIGKRPDEIVISYGEYGKPFLKNETIEFNFTHCQELGLLAITLNQELGIDVEKVGRIQDWANIVNDSLSAKEQHELSGYPKNEQEAAFICAWTRKEAFTKAIGMGLLYDFSTFSVTLKESAPKVVNDESNGQDLTHWSVLNIDVDKPYVAALSIQRNNMELLHFQFPR